MTNISSLPNFSSNIDENIIATMRQIHERIKDERIKAGLSEDEMAEKLQIKRSTYQYWEKTTPSVEKIKEVSKVLGLPEVYFFINPDENVPRESIPDFTQKKPTNQTVTLDTNSLLGILKASLKEYADQVIAEKEARRIDAERNKDQWIEAYNGLMQQFGSSLRQVLQNQDNIQEGIKVTAAYQMFWLDKWAEKETGGDPEETEKLAKSYRIKVAEKLGGKIPVGNPLDQDK